MADSLFEAAPGFDQPIAVLKHCHDRIRKQLRTMRNLAERLSASGLTAETQQGASAVLRYFDKAAPHHHEDEEQDLLPMLRATATGADAEMLDGLTLEIMSEHQQMDIAWQTLAQQLHAIAEGASLHLSAENVNRFAELYAAHMEKEETFVTPMATRLFSAAQMEQLGNAMCMRRGIA